MLLAWLIIILISGGLLAWLAGRWSAGGPRYVALGALALDLGLALLLWARPPVGGPWLAELSWPWVPQLGISFALGIDGLSLPLVLLTLFLGIIAVLVSWNEIQQRVGFFHANLLLTLAGIVGVFVALDLFLFYFFWELMLVPMYFLIVIWGHERRVYAAVKFFIFTQASGLLMLLAILGLAFAHGQATGSYTFSYRELLGTELPTTTARWLMWGFLLAFLVKLPAVPFHSWLPDAHSQAPTAGSVILAGLLLKTGAYGLLRFVLPLFPTAVDEIAALAMWLGALGVLYGALLAFAQDDLKRLVAYTSVSHMGFVLIGAFARTPLALGGTLMQMICHGLSTGALFVLAGMLYERLHTRDLRQMGGFWKLTPRMGAVALVFAMASLGLPGLGNFVGEFLVLLGAYQVNVAVTAVAALGLVVATVYSLWLLQRAFLGPTLPDQRLPDLSRREVAVAAALIVAILWLGVYPQPVLDVARPALEGVVRGE